MDPLALALAAVFGLAAGVGLARWRRGPGNPGPRPEAAREEQVALIALRASADAIPMPVVVADAEGGVIHPNPLVAAALPRLVAGHGVGDVSASLAEIVLRVGAEGGTLRETVIVGDPSAAFRVVATRVEGRVVVALEDATEDVDFEEARRTFSAAVSHELRTPLARILGLAETLALPGMEDEREEIVQQIESEVDGMRRLFDEMLLLAALDRGRLAVADGEVDLAAVARRVVEDARVRRLGRGRQLELDTAGEVRVPVAERLCEVVVQNLVDNALLHGGTEAGVVVGVRRDDEDGVAELVVVDDGVGIDAQHLPHVFQRFYRGDASRTGPGSGLGLALVKHIVEAHGGAVAAESDGASGTTLRVRLPIAS